MNRTLLIIIGIIGLFLGIASAFIPFKLIIVLGFGVAALIYLLADYQRVAYIVALYPILYYVTNNFVGIPVLVTVWDELLLVFCFCVLLFKWFFRRKDKTYTWTPMDFPLIIFLAIGIFLLFINSIDFRIGLDGLRAIAEYMIFFFIVTQLLRNETGARRFIYALVFAGAFMGLVGIYQYIVGVETPAYWNDKVEMKSASRVFSIIGNPNALGALLVLLISLSVSLILTEKKVPKKLLFSACAISMVLCLLFTGSRSSWIAFGVAALVYSILNKDMRIIVGLGLVAALAYIFIPSVQNRIAYMLDPAFITSSFTGGRFMRWPKAIEIWKQNFWFGLGLGRFGGAVAISYKIPGAFYVDNYYLKIAPEMGIFGFTLFLTLLYNSLAWTLRSLKKVKEGFENNIVKSAFSGMCGLLVTNIFLNNFDAPSVVTYYWIVVAVVIYMGYVNKEKKELVTA